MASDICFTKRIKGEEEFSLLALLVYSHNPHGYYHNCFTRAGLLKPVTS